jgi:hypothetical protein
MHEYYFDRVMIEHGGLCDLVLLLDAQPTQIPLASFGRSLLPFVQSCNITCTPNHEKILYVKDTTATVKTTLDYKLFCCSAVDAQVIRNSLLVSCGGFQSSYVGCFESQWLTPPKLRM